MSERLKWPKERWLEEVAAWRGSGKPLQTYARENGLSVFALRYWMLRSEGRPRAPGKPAASGAPAPKFIALKPAAASGGAIEIRCGAFAVAVSAGFDAGVLAAVLAVLERRA